MQTLRVSDSISRFTALGQLVRCVAGAPFGTKGAPCVMVRVEKSPGEASLTARTRDTRLDTQLLLPATDAELVRSSEQYVKDRLAALGFEVVSTEAQLNASMAH